MMTPEKAVGNSPDDMPRDRPRRHPGAKPGQEREQRLEIRFRQGHLEHLDELKAAIPQARESVLTFKVLEVPVDLVTERALQLLKAFQVEYKIHPLLEEHDAFAQG